MSTGIFFGRFQPFHEGHKKCIEKILEKHSKCIVIIRDTPISERNPIPLQQRIEMIHEAYKDNPNVKIRTVPDDDEDTIVYIGRDVGYGLVQLDEQTEKISATDIRKKLYEKT